jgi:outer membrane protein TolC
MYSQRGSAYSNMVSINLSVPLQWDQKNRQDREVAARLALAEQMRAQREEATRGHVAETRNWLQQWRSSRDRLSHYDSALIPLAGERTRAAIAAYRGGSGPLASVLDARRMEIDTRMDRLRLEMEAAALWARLEYLIPAEHLASAADRPPAPKEQQR